MSIRDNNGSDWHGGGGSINNGGGGSMNGGVGGGFGGSGGGGNGAGVNGGYNSRQGLSTGNNIYGNTAFGAPGGMAQGYATRDQASLGRAGMGPTMGNFGQFNNLNGSPMFAGSPFQGASSWGMGAGQAYGNLNNGYQAWQQAQQPHVGGLLSGEEVTQGSIPPAVTPQISQPLPPAIYDVTPGLPRPGGAIIYNQEAYPGSYYTPAQISNYRAQQSSWNMRNPTQRPYNGNTSPDRSQLGAVRGGPSYPQPSLPR